MVPLPRLALATPATGPEPSPACLALLAGLGHKQHRVQHFRALARPFSSEQLAPITGLPGRHLDSWLMPPEVCREVFARGSAQASIAVVEGTLDEAEIGPWQRPYNRPGRLAPLIDCLDLPTVVLLDARTLLDGHLPRLHDRAEAVLIDHLPDPESFGPLRDLVQLATRRRVIGAVEALPHLRATLAETPADRPPPIELVEPLARSFLQFADLPALATLAASRPFPSGVWARRIGRRRPFRVAYAHDEAFGGYFPDTLEMLEALGAELEEFSPLRSEDLPASVDLVMIGCGFPDEHAAALAANLSLISALRAHVCSGRRIYSEGGGTAYLGRSMILGEGLRVPGAGILPVDSELRRSTPAPYPVARTLTRDGWLGPRGTVVRGYHSSRWNLRPAPEPGDCPVRSGLLTAEGDVYFRHHAVGSLIHLHLAALPEVVSAFVGPAPALPGPSRFEGGRGRDFRRLRKGKGTILPVKRGGRVRSTDDGMPRCPFRVIRTRSRAYSFAPRSSGASRFRHRAWRDVFRRSGEVFRGE